MPDGFRVTPAANLTSQTGTSNMIDLSRRQQQPSLECAGTVAPPGAYAHGSMPLMLFVRPQGHAVAKRFAVLRC